jgi:hypothetical protein
MELQDETAAPLWFDFSGRLVEQDITRAGVRFKANSTFRR